MASVVNWGALPAEEAPGGVRRRRVVGAEAELVRVEIPAGTRAGRHSHPHEQFVQVLAGSGTLETEAGIQGFREGSVFHFPPDAWHAAEFHTDTVLVETNLGARGG